MSELKVSDVSVDPEGKPPTGHTPLSGESETAPPPPNPAAFVPIAPPPSDYHNFGMGLSSENGDSPKTVAEKINAGFKHVYSLLASAGHSIATPVENSADELMTWVSKTFVSITEHKALADEVAEVKAKVEAIPEPVETVAKADFDKLAAEHAALQDRFVQLGTKLEKALGLS
jgi:hypothetical protein